MLLIYSVLIGLFILTLPEEISKSQDDMAKEIEERIEKKMMFCLDGFKQDVVTCLTDILEQKINDNSTSKIDIRKDNLTKAGNTSRSDEITTSNTLFSTHTTESKNISSKRANNTTNHISTSQTLGSSTQNYSNDSSELITLVKNNKSNCETKDIIAQYDIDLKHPKQLFLVPKDYLANLTLATGNITQIHLLRKGISPLIHLKMNKARDRNHRQYLLKDIVQVNIPSHRLKSRLYAHQTLRRNFVQKYSRNYSSPCFLAKTSSYAPVSFDQNSLQKC